MMNKRSSRGFTLIEVVLAVAVGLIIIAGVSVGYTYAKRAAILDNQRKDAGAIKTFVEQAIASQQADMASGGTGCGSGGTGICPPIIATTQFAQLAMRLPSLQNDPYTGQGRFTAATPPDAVACPGPCFAVVTALDGDGTADLANPDMDISTGKMDDTNLGLGSWTTAGSGVAYVRGDLYQTVIRVALSDGTTKTFVGYAVIEGDLDGNIVAAEGGEGSLGALKGAPAAIS